MWLNWYMAAVELEFESLDFCCRSQVFKTQDASFHYPFQRMLTYHIFSPYCANLQNPSCLVPKPL